MSASIFEEKDDSQNEIDALFYKIDNDNSILSLKLSNSLIDHWFEGKKREFELFICLDISGSMSGSGITQAKQAILYLIESLITHNTIKEKDITCMFFQSICTVKRFADDPDLLWDNGKIKNYFNTVNAYGGTNFISVFEKISENIKYVKKDLAIIFFTDGQNNTKINFNDVKKELHNGLSSTGHATEIHTIGFTSDHDAALLSWLTNLGTKQGNFQYVKSSTDIQGTMETTVGLFELGEHLLYVKVGLDKILPINIDHDGDGKIILKGESSKLDETISIYLSKEKSYLLNDTESNDDDNNNNNKIRVPLKQIQPNEKIATSFVIIFIQSEITKLTDQIINLNVDEGRGLLDKISQQVSVHDEYLNNTIANTYKIKTPGRKLTIQQCLETKSMVHQFKNILAEALKGTLTNEKIANFNNLAYDNITKNRLKKKMNNRAVKNVRRLEEIEKRIEDAVKKLDFKKLEDNETEENLKTLTCTLTTDNYIESLKCGECMCLTLDVARPQSAIADPSKIRIKKINQSFLNSESFLTSVEYALGESIDSESVHGGFQSNISANVVKGLANENITGILPLYINEYHWLVAKEKIKPIMGYITTLDIFGYAYDQVTTVPFLVLAKSLTDTSTEFHRKQFKLILDTCDAIYKQSETLREENKKLFENYMKSPINRTIDQVANNLVYLGHLLCAIRCGDVDKHDLSSWIRKGMFAYIIEETIRRRLNKYEKVEEMMNNVPKVLGIDLKAFINDPIDEYERLYSEYNKNSKLADNSENIKYMEAFKNALKLVKGAAAVDNDDQKSSEQNNNKKEMKDEIIAPTVQTKLFDPDNNQLPEPMTTSIIDTIKQSISDSLENILIYKKIFELLITNDLFIEEIITKPEFSFKSNQTLLTESFFNQYTSKTLLATIYQSFLHRQNNVRRQVIESDSIKFFEPFSENDSTRILQTYFNEYVAETLNKKVVEVINKYSDLENFQVMLTFCDIENVEEAAGLLLLDVTFRGSRMFGQIVKALQMSNLKLADEKIQMVVNGKWNDVVLFYDKSKTNSASKDLVWIPSKKNIYRTLKAHKKILSNMEYWIELFPTYKSYIEKQYDENYLKRRRLEGIEKMKMKKKSQP